MGRAFWAGVGLGALCALVAVAAAVLSAARGGVHVRLDGRSVAAAVAEQARRSAEEAMPALWRRLAAEVPEQVADGLDQRLREVHVRVGPFRAPLPPEGRAAVTAWVRSALAEVVAEAGSPGPIGLEGLERQIEEALRRALRGRSFSATVGGLRLPVRVFID